MTEQNKGGRPTERGEVKNAAVAVRTTPTIKAALKRAADEAGRSITQEIERRIEVSLSGDRVRRSVETEALLNDLAREIDQIEQARGKRWHKDLETWAAVAEAIKGGAIERARPDKPVDDEFVMAAIKKLIGIRDAKEPHLALLRFVGVEAPVTPYRYTPAFRNALKPRRGLFGSSILSRIELPPLPSPPSISAGDQSDMPTLGSMIFEAVASNTRISERHAVEALDGMTDKEREILNTAINALIELDRLEEEADKEVDELIAPYAAAIESGRQWYSLHMSARASFTERATRED